MDCCIASPNYNLQITGAFPNVSSPEMFDSDGENEITKRKVTVSAKDHTLAAISPPKPSQAELVVKSDNYMLARINKYLSGVPPPPKHTICQSNCSDLLQRIRENRQLFWTNYPLSNESSDAKPAKQATSEIINRNTSYQCTKGPSRNLTNAFNACDLSINAGSTELGANGDNGDSDNLSLRYNPSEETKSSVNVKKQTMRVPSIEDSSNVAEKRSPLLYHTTSEVEATALTWPQAFSHKYHGIHYNRSRTVEDFENLTVKLCERYIGAETQSTCNIWFSKQQTGSPRKRSLLGKRENGLSPGKRLTYLARRRRTFSSANLQGLGVTDKRQLMLQIKKPTCKKRKSPTKGKSPRGKSPRGKSPRGKSPRNSALKRVARRLTLDGPSPRKSKLETSKRALFQSPPADHPGPSKLLGAANVDTLKIKRVLFPTTQKKEAESDDAEQALLRESRKRKCDEELQGPRVKWSKSLSFDCMHELETSSKVTWDRHSSSNILLKNDSSFSQERTELSDVHRKKLLWAVAEALRSKGIGMSHPRFKQYAANLARTIKKFMPDLENKNIPRKPGSTSDRMLKLAKHHVLFLIDTRSTD
ncbi:PREDICTED: uncharacterized protein LOC106750162 [Dinoponera quadriceps]|uniref:Uncharacterized protein LOC106750162 n=1 Tax=Dinoponera quadriceps TaxID=609295 RepID=A0A6P3Y6W5_DINQU|nr:PREDICTED: uncharacterized protein LOC106750162 [Dinoponera quadriceps]XP_014485782.1 PREDICTED: uncharacterized protein LOC106750162 [Dinoponera quadriceps]